MKKETEPNTLVNFQLEEYKVLREEMRQREGAMTQLVLISLVAAVTLISGIAAFYFNVYTKNPCKITFLLSYLFLAPMLIIIPMLFIIRSQRRDIRRFASYIQVFFEETGCGLNWETAHDKWTDVKTGEGHDSVPWTYWALLTVCLAFYCITLHLSKVPFEFLHVIIPIVFFILMIYAHVTFARSKHTYYRESLTSWRIIYRDLNPKPDSSVRPNNALKSDPR